MRRVYSYLNLLTEEDSDKVFSVGAKQYYGYVNNPKMFGIV
jgi:hypothetical protein